MLYGYLNSPFVSNPFSDAAIPPTSLTSPVISGSGVIGQTLSTTNGTWSGTLPITFTYQWNRNGIIIVGATFNTYTLVTADGSTSITCTVTATNAGGSLSKNSNAISVAAATDADADAFIAAAAITNTTQKAAIDKLVVDLKGYGIWTKMKALYPFVGGTAAQHKFNLKNPLDTDASFRLVFSGGWVHSSTGAKPNGTNSWADTFFIPANQTAQNSFSFSSYTRTNSDGILCDIGATGTLANCYTTAFNKWSSEQKSACNMGLVYNTNASANSLGLFSYSRTASTTFKSFKNGALTQTSTQASSGNMNGKLTISAQNSNGLIQYYSDRGLGFTQIGDGLTDAEMANYYTAVQTFQTTLGRNV